MDPFSWTAGSLQILEQCLICLKSLKKKYNAYQQAEYEVSEALLRLKVLWIQIEIQINVIKDLWGTLPPDHQQTQLSLICILDTKLDEVCRLLDSVIGFESNPASTQLKNILVKKGRLDKVKYAATKKQQLDQAVEELIGWHDLFDRTWRLLARLPGDNLDHSLLLHPKDSTIQILTSLRKSFRNLESEDDTAPRAVSSYDFLELRNAIPASCNVMAQFEDRKRLAIVDKMSLNPNMNAAGTTRSVKALAKALSRSDPATFGFLRCCGVINKSTEYEFVFEVPLDFDQSPRSLRDLLQNTTLSLNTKLEIANQLANSVFHLHAIGFVHKNIRPDSILIFDRKQDNSQKQAYLFGFENYRMVQDETYLTGDERPERELYRHPSRQGSNIQRRYTMQHDIYSLGICLLEIGLWQSLVTTSPQVKVLDFGIDPEIKTATKRANAIKKKLLIMVDEQLAPLVGVKYKNIVGRCLMWFDDEETAGKEGPRVDVGLQFIDDVLNPLKEIVV